MSTPAPQTMTLYEVYEANGNLLLVTSDLDRRGTRPSDTIVRRVWSTVDECHPNCEQHGKSPCEGIDCEGRER